MSIYDFYGFVVSVEGPADRLFSEEYGYFKILKTLQKIDMIIKVDEEKLPLPTQWGSNKGMHRKISWKID